jgi:competence protein ComGF
MKIYREMILGQGTQCSQIKLKLAALLKNYVTLDTASQWMIFEHWRHRLKVV